MSLIITPLVDAKTLNGELPSAFADASHTHAESEITNLTTDLANKEGKLTAGTTSQYYRGDKVWTTLDKTAVGLSNVDNTSDVNKPIGTATQTALNAKLDLSSYTASDVLTKLKTVDGAGSGLDTDLFDGLDSSNYEYKQTTNTVRNNLGTPTIAEMALFHGQYSNKFRFIPPYSQEESLDGIAWVASSRASTANLKDMMRGEGEGASFSAIPISAIGGSGYYRLVWDNSQTGYVCLNHLYAYCSTNGNNVSFKVEQYHNTNGWSTLINGTANNWPGHVSLPHSSIWFSSSASQYGKVRVTFSITNATYANPFSLYGIEWFGGYPAGKRNAESYDGDKNVTFPANVRGTQLISSVAQGTPPMVVTSTTKVVNLNAEKLDDQEGTYYLARANHTGTQLASTISDLASSVVSTVLTGLSTTTNAVITASDSVLTSLGKLQKQTTDNLGTLTSHTGSTSNPHSVTKAQVGLGSVDNTSDVNKPVSTAQQSALDLKANLASPTFTGTVTLPSTTNIGTVTNIEIGYLDGVTSAIQTQLNGKEPSISKATGFNLALETTASNIKMNGTASVGILSTLARADHIHPSDSTKAGTSVATAGANGLMSSIDKSKLDGIATGANNYTLPIATASTLGGVKQGTNIVIDANGVINAVSNDSASIIFKSNTVTLPSVTNTVSLIGGEITEFNKLIDGLLVFKNSTYIEVGQDYNIGADGVTIIKVGGGTWEAGTIFNFKKMQGSSVTNWNTDLIAKLDSASKISYVVKEEEFIVSGGQTTFNLTKGTYAMGTNVLEVYFNGVKIASKIITELSSTSFSIPSGVSDGTLITVRWVQSTNATLGTNHNYSHLPNGDDPIPLATAIQDGLMSKEDKAKVNATTTTLATTLADGLMSKEDKVKVDATITTLATTSQDGIMSAIDKSKLDLIQTNASGIAITNAISKCPSDVAIAVIGTWYTGASITLEAGTWMINSQITLLRNTTTALTYFARVSDGTNHYASASAYMPSITNNIITLPMSTIITLASTTTINVQATASQTATIKSNLITYDMGSNATQIMAVKIG